MPVPNHLAIVQQEHDAQPPDTSSAEGILAFVVRVLRALPIPERAGLHRKDAGENIAFYAPAGVNVGISRVMYPNGDLVKILTDAGPGGVNVPAWNDEEPIDPTRYIAVFSVDDPPVPEPPDVPVPPPLPVVDLSVVLQKLDATLAELAAVRAEIADTTREVLRLEDMVIDVRSRQDRALAGSTKAFGGPLTLRPQG